MSTTSALVRAPGRITKGQQRFLEKLVEEGKYANESEALRAAITHFAEDRYPLFSHQTLVVEDFSQFLRLAETAKMLMVNQDPSTALRNKSRLNAIAMGVSFQGMDLMVRHVVPFDDPQKVIIKDDYAAGELIDDEGDKYRRRIYTLSDGQTVEIREYVQADVSRLDLALSALEKYESPSMRRDRKNDRERAKVDTAVQECMNRVYIKRLQSLCLPILRGEMEESAVQRQLSYLLARSLSLVK